MERYKPIIDDWKAFRDECQRHAVSTIRRNQIKAGKDFEERLYEVFSEAEKTDWNLDVYRLPETKSPGKSMLHWLGEYYVQEESATVPVEVLDPQPGEKILDMAAAPGGKTTQIASKIENQGMVVANDVSSKRMQSLHANIYRTGSACVAATNYDARNLPEDTKYDRILLDAPCTGEGNRCRRSFEAAAEDELKGISKLQKQLIEKAEKLLKENGVMVYSTCTFSPRENEEVIEYALEETGLDLERVELETEHVRGVTEFEEKQYSEEMKKTVRIYPHHLNSGGMYVAKLRK